MPYHIHRTRSHGLDGNSNVCVCGCESMRVQYVTAAGFLDLIYFFAFACVCVCVSVCVSVCLDIPVYAISPLFQKGSSDVSPHTTLSFSR